MHKTYFAVVFSYNFCAYLQDQVQGDERSAELKGGPDTSAAEQAQASEDNGLFSLNIFVSSHVENNLLLFMNNAIFL